MEFQWSCFKSWKMMLWNCYTQYASKSGKLSSGPDWKRSVSLPIPKKGNAKECSNYCTFALTSHVSKNNAQNSPSQASRGDDPRNFQMFKLVLEKAEEPEIKLPTFLGSLKKQESSRKTSTSVMSKLLTVWITTNWKILKETRNTRPSDLPLEKSVCRSGSNS